MVYSHAVSEDEKALQGLTEQCNEVGQELTNALEKAKVQGLHKPWKSVRQALKSVLGGDGIQDIYNRLKQYREPIAIVLLVVTSSKQTALDENVQRIKNQLVESETRIVGETRQSNAQLLHAIQNPEFDHKNPQDVATVSDLFLDMVWRAAAHKQKEGCLNNLYY